MDRLNKMDREELVRRMREDFERTMLKVADAVNDAPEGHLIDGSEEQVGDLLGDFRRRAFETAAQMRVEATESSPAFSPGEEPAGSSRDGDALGAQLQRPIGTASGPVPKRGRRDGGAGERWSGLDRESDRVELACPDHGDSGLFPRQPACASDTKDRVRE